MSCVIFFFSDYWQHFYSFSSDFASTLAAIILCVACINLLHPHCVCAKMAVQLCTHISSLLPCCASFPAVQICPISHGLTGWNSVWNGAAIIQTLNNKKENFTDTPIFCPPPAGRQRWGAMLSVLTPPPPHQQTVQSIATAMSRLKNILSTSSLLRISNITFT